MQEEDSNPTQFSTWGMAIDSRSMFGDLQSICHSLDKCIEEALEKIGSGALTKGKVEVLLQKLSVAAVLNKGDCRWIAQEDEDLVESMGVARIKQKRVFFKDLSVAEYLSAVAVFNRLYNFAPLLPAQIDGIQLSRILAEQIFQRVRSFLNWKIANVPILQNVSAEARSLLKNLELDKIELAVTIQVEHLFHVANMLSEAGLHIAIKN